MKNRFWAWLTRNQAEGQFLPARLLVIRAILFPIDFLYWRLSSTRGYQWETDIWLIDGIKYSGAGMRALANSAGEIYKIERKGDVITISRIEYGKSR